MIPFSPPRIDEKTIEAVSEVLRSGWITTGPKTKLFEKKLSEYCGNEYTLCLNSGSAGLELMLRWFGIGPGDEVILPAYTYAATANVVMHCGAKPVFVDSGSDFNMDVSKLQSLITPNTKCIMPVDIAGLPCDYDFINELVESDPIKKMFKPATKEQETLGRIFVLSDAAHSLGAIYKGKRTGILADATVFSFHAVKNLTTAEGGAVALNLPEPFNNEELYKYLCIKSLHGQSKDALAKMQAGNWRYDIIEPGYKMNMTDIQAAIGLVELERYENDNLVRRKEIFDAYAESFSKEDYAILPEYESAIRTSSYHVFLLRFHNIGENQRNTLMNHIFEEKVSVNVHFVPLPMMSFYAKNYNINDYPVAYSNYSSLISLPVFYDLTDNQIEKVITAVKNSVRKINI